MSTDETLSADESKVSGVPGAFINHAVCATVTQGVDKGLSITLQKQVVVIGTDSACDLVLTDRTVSRRHIGLHRTLTGVEVEDVGSKGAERAQRFKEAPAPQQTAVCEAPRPTNEPDMLSLPFKEAKGRLIESFEREYLPPPARPPQRQHLSGCR